MQLALSAPVLKSIAVAGLALGLSVAASSRAPARVTHRLALHAVDAPDAIYLTAFRNGDIYMTFEGGKLSARTIKTYASVWDGCRWLGIERMTPRDERSFDYDYSERILECDPGATPTRKTPRQGIVTVED
jgi:hypothetical protein